MLVILRKASQTIFAKILLLLLVVSFGVWGVSASLFTSLPLLELNGLLPSIKAERVTRGPATSPRTIRPTSTSIDCTAVLTSSWVASVVSDDPPPPPPTPPASEWVNSCTDWDDWDKAGPPYQIYGNTYYVGTCGISAILVTGDKGHILIDGATEAGADVIANNIRSLGFALSDIKLLLQSHEHFDHVAGLARL